MFAYIGLQLKFVLTGLAGSDGLVRTLVVGGVLLVAAIVLRMAGVFGLFGNWVFKHRMMTRRVARVPVARQRHEQYLERRCGGEPLGPADVEGHAARGLDRDARQPHAGRGGRDPAHDAGDAPFPGWDAIQGSR